MSPAPALETKLSIATTTNITNTTTASVVKKEEEEDENTLRILTKQDAHLSNNNNNNNNDDDDNKDNIAITTTHTLMADKSVTNNNNNNNNSDEQQNKNKAKIFSDIKTGRVTETSVEAAATTTTTIEKVGHQAEEEKLRKQKQKTQQQEHCISSEMNNKNKSKVNEMKILQMEKSNENNCAIGGGASMAKMMTLSKSPPKAITTNTTTLAINTTNISKDNSTSMTAETTTASKAETGLTTPTTAAATTTTATGTTMMNLNCDKNNFNSKNTNKINKTNSVNASDVGKSSSANNCNDNNVEIKIENCDENIVIKTETEMLECANKSISNNSNNNNNTNKNDNINSDNQISKAITKVMTIPPATSSSSASSSSSSVSTSSSSKTPAVDQDSNRNQSKTTNTIDIYDYNEEDTDNKPDLEMIVKDRAEQKSTPHGDYEQRHDPNDLIFARPKPVLLTTVNSHIICNLCYGYLIDATTIVECLHSFCHSCLIKHLRTEQYCPRCEMMINTAKPNIKPDTTLQAIVYKLVPGLYEKELIRKRAFYKDRPEEAALATPEQRGDDTEHLIFSPSDYMSLSLEYADVDEHVGSNTEYAELLRPRYLQCPAKFTVAHMKKFVQSKFAINTQSFGIDIMYKVKTIVLLDHYTLMDVAYIYTWKRDAPMRFFFRVKEILRPIRMLRNRSSSKKERISNTSSSNNNNNPGVYDNRLMTVIHSSPSTATTAVAQQKPKLLPLTEIEIKVEDEIKAEDASQQNSSTSGSGLVAPTTTTSTTTAKAGKREFEIVSPRSSDSNSTDGGKSPNDNLKITIVSKPSKERGESKLLGSSAMNNAVSSESSKAIKSHKEKRVSFAADINDNSHHQQPKEERKVENIKLKIDLSKQNSVTIINMSDPERREIVKPVRVDKEWKVKSKKEKDGNGNNNLKNSPMTVPPLTLKADRSSSSSKTSPKYTSTSSPSFSSSSSSSMASSCLIALPEEERKSQFLKSFALAPISELKNLETAKSTKSTTFLQQTPIKNITKLSSTKTSPPKSNEKSNTPPKSNSSSPPKSNGSSTAAPFCFKEPIRPVSASTSLSIKKLSLVSASKRKNKEPVKAVAKKPRLSPPPLATQTPLPLLPNPIDDFKIKLPPRPYSNNTSNTMTSTTSKLTTMQAPTTTKTQAQSFASSSTTSTTTTTASKSSTAASKLMPPPPPATAAAANASTLMRPPTGVPPKKTPKSMYNHGKTLPANAVTPHPTLPGVQIAPPGNRTPIAKRYQPILPKTTRPNPFANLPSDMNQILKDAGTEIKSIPGDTTNKMKVYGLKGPQAPAAVNQSQPTIMGPPPIPKPKTSANAQQQQHHQQQQRSSTTTKSSNSTSSGGAVKPINASSSNSYRNFALYNASKTKGNEVPPGCRTPIYTPNSPIYSPSSPQYVSNYNIPTVPQYKYTPKPTGSNESLLQSLLSNSNALSSLFPSPPTRKSDEGAATSSTTTTSTKSDATTTQASGKRSYPFKRSPSPIEDPPEKQLKVKSLLNSCNINIPSSLSITITREDTESQSNSTSHPKHKSPVNNYIEILKLPEHNNAMEPNSNINSNANAKRQSPPVFKSMPPPPTPSMAVPNSLKGKHNTSSSTTITSQILMPPPGKTTSATTSVIGNQKPPTPPLSGNTSKQQSLTSSQNNVRTSNGNVNSNNTKASPLMNQSSGNIKSVPSPKHSPQEINSKTVTPKSSPTSSQQVNEKKGTPSPEKRNSTGAITNSSSTANENNAKLPKSPSSTNAVASADGSSTAKKFRPILPRQDAPSISEVVPSKVTGGNVIGTYSSPSGVSVKIHSKKNPTTKKSPGMQQQHQGQQQKLNQQPPHQRQSPQLPIISSVVSLSSQQQQQKQQQALKAGGIPRGIASSRYSPTTKPGASPASGNMMKKLPSSITPPPTSSPNGMNIKTHGVNTVLGSLPKVSSHITATTQSPSPSAMATPAPTPLGGLMSAAGLNANAAAAQLLKENLLRAQVHAAAAADPVANMIYSYANAAAAAQMYNNSPMYSYQQAYIMEQLQRANTLSEYMKMTAQSIEQHGGVSNGNNAPENSNNNNSQNNSNNNQKLSTTNQSIAKATKDANKVK